MAHGPIVASSDDDLPLMMLGSVDIRPPVISLRSPIRLLWR